MLASRKCLVTDAHATLLLTKLRSLPPLCVITSQPFNTSLANNSYIQLSEVTNVSSILPGTLVQSLITAVHPTGLNLQVLGFFEGTVDQLHLRHDATEKTYKVGKKVKARVLYDFSATPPRFALSLAEHVLGLGVRRLKRDTKPSTSPGIQEAYPVGTVLNDLKVLRVETERGLILEVEPGLEGFVHVRPFPLFKLLSC